MGNEFPPKPYTEVESEYVHEAIREGDFEDEEHRRYVNDLVAIETYVLDGPSGFASGMHYGQLRNRHPDAYDAIQRELDPETYRRRKGRETVREAETRAQAVAETVRRTEQERHHRAAWEAVSESA